MCQANEDDINSVMESKLDYKVFRKCLKCDENSVIVTRISEALCKHCFLEYFTHKFRATIGKHKILEKDENVLFAYSASGSSVAMLNLIAKGVGEEAKKKFTFKTNLIYVEDNYLFNSGNDYNHAKRIELIRKHIEESVKYSNFNVYYALLENSYLYNDVETTTKEVIFSDDPLKLESNEANRSLFLKLVNDVKNQTSREELIKRFRLKLINRVAKALNIKKILFAMSCTKLTIELLSNVSIGKGAHLSSEMSLVEEKENGQVIYLRPLRELTSKEIAFYNHYTKKSDSIHATNTSLLNVPNSTIYRLTEKFINGLQNDYPTTVATIFRTSDKLTPIEDFISDNNVPLCKLCECKLDTKTNASLASSAINDLEYSNFISRLNQNNQMNQNGDKFLDEKFCYSCSIVINDLKDKNILPESFYAKKLGDHEMKEKIKDFLI